MPTTTKSLIRRLVSICKGTLSDGTDKEQLLDLCAQYDINLYEDEWSDTADIVLSTVPKILAKSKTPVGSIDFDDMIWLPVIWALPVRKFDFLVVDESQDLNKVQQELALMIGKRIIMVGDKHQAIYGFRGADVKSMDNLAAVLAKSPLGLKTFPLTVTRRCPRLVTAIARNIVPLFECPDDAPDGFVCYGTHQVMLTGEARLNPSNYTYERVKYLSPDDSPNEPGHCTDDVPQRGDMVLCRVNAPLVQLAYTLIRAQIPCKIQGRDIGVNLVTLIKKLVQVDASTEELLEALAHYSLKERGKIQAANVNSPDRAEQQLGALQDKVDCIFALAEGLDTAKEIVARIGILFSDVQKGNTEGFVLLSTVHKAKGLEAHTVRIIQPELLPHPMAKLPWQKEQEMNLLYVAITRSIHTLHIH